VWDGFGMGVRGVNAFFGVWYVRAHVYDIKRVFESGELGVYIYNTRVQRVHT
jgi:hypothetical protein